MGHDALNFIAWNLPLGRISALEARRILAGRVSGDPGLFPSPLSQQIARQTLESSRGLEGAGSLGSGVAFMYGSLIRGAVRCVSGFGLMSEAQDWPARDGIPVRLVWVLVVKDDAPRSVARDLGLYLGGLLGDAGLVEALVEREGDESARLFESFVQADVAAQKALAGGAPSEALRAMDRGLELVPGSHRLAEKRALALAQTSGSGGYSVYKRKENL